MKKIAYSLILFTILVVILAPAVFAAGTSVTVSSATAQPGSEVVLSVTMTGNTGFGSGKYIVSYDASALTLVDLDVSRMLLDGAAVNDAKGIISFAKANSVTSDGVLFTAKFKVADTAPEGAYSVSVNVLDVVNAETKVPVSITTTAGKITVKAPHVCSGTYVKQVDATCTASGMKAHYVCECGKLYSDANCTTAVTSASLKINAKGHSYGAWTETKAPTCTAKGERQHTCSVCGYTEKGSVKAKGHSYGEWTVTKEPTVTEKGEKFRTCSVCNHTDTVEMDAIVHIFGEWVETKAPTCTEKGEETRTCGECGETETREVAAKGHSYGEWAQSKAPTCTENGEDSRTCACGETETREGEAATGHSMGEWTLTKEPTCTEKGEETRTCSCGETETREVDMIDHEWHWVTDREPTSKKEGLKHEACKHCDATRSEGTVIEKLKGNDSIFWIVLILIVLAVLGGGGYYFYKRRMIR